MGKANAHYRAAGLSPAEHNPNTGSLVMLILAIVFVNTYGLLLGLAGLDDPGILLVSLALQMVCVWEFTRLRIRSEQYMLEFLRMAFLFMDCSMLIITSFQLLFMPGQ